MADILAFIPAALLGRSSALSLSFLPHVTALLLFKHGSLFNLISLFLFSFDKGKEIFSNRLKTRPLTQDQVQWAIRGNRILMANAKLWERVMGTKATGGRTTCALNPLRGSGMWRKVLGWKATARGAVTELEQRARVSWEGNHNAMSFLCRYRGRKMLVHVHNTMYSVINT